MEAQIKVHVGWTGENFCAGCEDDVLGVVVACGKTLEEVKAEFEDALKFCIECCVDNGDDVPLTYITGKYDLAYELDAAALLRDAERYTTMAAISRASGINQKQLSHYANGIKKPRPIQRERIIIGLHAIGRHVMALC